MKSKRIIVFLLALFLSATLMAQNFIQTTDGKCYWTDDPVTDNNEVRISIGPIMKRIPFSDIVLVENLEYGVEVLQPDKLRKLRPVETVLFRGAASQCAAGRKVYIPIARGTIMQRWGAKQLSELLLYDGHWQVVGSPEQADFLLEYVHDEKGRDKYYLCLKYRTGEQILRSRHIRVLKRNPKDAGIESAKKLYDNYLRNGLYKNDYENWTPTNCGFTDVLFANVGAGSFLGYPFYGFTIDISLNHRTSKSFAYGLGLEYDYVNTEIHRDGYYYYSSYNERRSHTNTIALFPYFFNTFYITKHYYPTYFKFNIGIPISIRDGVTSISRIESLSNQIVEIGYDTIRYTIGSFSITYGKQWKNLSLEGTIGLKGIKSEFESIDYTTQEKDNFTFTLPSPFLGIKLNYKIPIIDHKEELIRK